MKFSGVFALLFLNKFTCEGAPLTGGQGLAGEAMVSP